MSERWTEEQVEFSTRLLKYKGAAMKRAQRIIFRRPCGVDAEDVFSDSLVKAVNNYSSMRTAHVSTWFMRIVINTALDRLRRNSPAMLSLNQILLSDQFDRDTNAAHRGLSHHVEHTDRLCAMECITKARLFINDECWGFFTLISEGFEYEEMSEIYNMPASTIKVKVFRARAELKRSMKFKLVSKPIPLAMSANGS